MEAAAVEIRQFLVPPPPLPFPEKVAFTPLLLVNWSGGEGGGIIISPAIASEHARERARDGRGGGGGGVSLSHVQTYERARRRCRYTERIGVSKHVAGEESVPVYLRGDTRVASRVPLKLPGHLCKLQQHSPCGTQMGFKSRFVSLTPVPVQISVAKKE